MKSGTRKAVAAAGGRVANQPSFVQKSGGGKPWANSRSPVPPKFNTKKKHD